MKVAEIFETMDYGPVPESDEIARRWLQRHSGRFGHFIAGTWHPAREGKIFQTLNPSTGEPLATLAQGGEDDVDSAVLAASEALPAWSGLRPHARARYLYALARQLQKHARLFAVLESLDSGKSIREAGEIDVPLAIRHLYHHAGWAQLLEREFPDHIAHGVVGQVITWNLPLLMLTWKVAPALATGNTIVLKPAEETALTALLFAELSAEIGLPGGVLNIVTGDHQTGDAIVRHQGVSKITFTGSVEAGRSIRTTTAGSGKRLSLELGGESPFIVYDDADLDSVVEGVVDAIWFNLGKDSPAGSRILVQEGIAERLTEKLETRVEVLRVGDPLERTVDLGRANPPDQMERVQSLIASMMTFRSPAEAVELANNTRYGLAASIWTEETDLAIDTARKLQAGTVWVNSVGLLDAAVSFGGYRESGLGREGGREGLWEYLRPRWELDAPRKKRPEHHSEPLAAPTGIGTVDSPSLPEAGDGSEIALPPIERTPKLYIGGAQLPPASGYSIPVLDATGRHAGEVGLGGREDIRKAVEAARGAGEWAEDTAHNRAQVLYYLAENLAARAPELSSRISTLTGRSTPTPEQEVDLSVERLFTYAAWADKWDGSVHSPPLKGLTVAIYEPLGVLGIICPTTLPLLGLISTIAPAIAVGNRVIVIPSEAAPLIVTDLYQILDTSDLPNGVINLITGPTAELAATLAAHDDVDGIWDFEGEERAGEIERLSAGNLKRTWVGYGIERDWLDPQQGEGTEFLRRATEVKSIWIPYGA